MVIESCCIVVVLLFLIFVVLFLFTKNSRSTYKNSPHPTENSDTPKTDSPHPAPPDYIPTYHCSHCSLNFVQPVEIERNGSIISVCPECKSQVL